MEGFQIFSCLKGSLGHQFLLFIVWSSSFQVAVALQNPLEPNHVSSTSELGTPPISGLFGPIEISPSVLPRYPYPGENLAPMYPTFPTTYEPNLTGKCPVNFTAMSNVIDRTASDCSQPLAALVGNNAVADDCFSDIISILASRGANITIPTLCSVKSLNLTGGLCPVKDVVNFEKIVNTSKLLEACSTVDPLKECCRPICQSAIMEAALEISGTQLTINDYKDSVTVPNHNDPLSDCKGVVFSYISRKLSADAASSAFRIVSACKVNKGTVVMIFLLYELSLSFCWTGFRKCVANVTSIILPCIYCIFCEVLLCFRTFHDGMM
ncbi:GPI-ANCHORED PROTEIN [Salix purpurea]|uniref:GPI-ANCHORED PROTEIN n=1 Tax=Salix purpurea TaxID=77065 RepID=A0A9Q0UPW1_SALPP|nr:GPI-ANCHORED PROTEIN [Salix purpurea]